jgi:uncharacterized membrane protein
MRARSDVNLWRVPAFLTLSAVVLSARAAPKGRDFTAEEIEKHVAEAASIESTKSGYVQDIDHETLACVAPRERASAIKNAIARAVSLGRHRTIQQDSEFGIVQIVEIGIRALSPAVNDTYTGVACVDWLGDALVVLAAAPPLEGHFCDANGNLRLRVRPLKLERIVKTAFDQIRRASADNPAVLVRMLDMIRRIAPRMPSDAAREALVNQARAIQEAAASASLVALDRADIEAAWSRIDTKTSSSSQA